jgi:hypothetical protein
MLELWEVGLGIPEMGIRFKRELGRSVEFSTGHAGRCNHA